MITKNNIYIKSLLLLFTVVISLPSIFAQEGSGNWTGTQTDRQSYLWVPNMSKGGVGNPGYDHRGYMMLPSNGNYGEYTYDPGHRLYVYVKKGETVYWGFRRASGSDRTAQWYYDNRAHDNTDTGSLGLFPSGVSGAGRVTYGTNAKITTSSGPNQTQATLGPNVPGVRTNGYNANSFTNNTGQDRAFWIELNSNGNGNQISYWDVSVYDGTTHKQGRVYSKYWSVYNGLPGTAGEVNKTAYHDDFGFFVPVDNTYSEEIPDDYYIKYANFGKSNAGYAVFFANDSGPLNEKLLNGDPDIEKNRKSKKGTSNRFQYPLFVADPDPMIWKTSLAPISNTDVRFKRKADATGGEAYFMVTVNTPGTLDILLDLDDSGGYSTGDVQIFKYFNVPGQYEVYWDGKDANNNIVPSGTKITLLTSANFFPVHFPVYDMEQSMGITLKNIRPVDTQNATVKLFWDHSNIYTGVKGTRITNNNSLGSNQWGTVPRNLGGTFKNNFVQSSAVNTTGVNSPNNIWWAGGNEGIGDENTMNVYAGSWMDTGDLNFIFDWDKSDIKLLKTVDNANPKVGSHVTFTIEVANLGLMYARKVTVTDKLPSGYEYVSHVAPLGSKVTPASGPNGTEAWDYNVQTTYDPITGIWTVHDIPYDKDASKNSIKLTITAKVLPAGDHDNTAVGKTDPENSDPNPDNNTSTVIVIVDCEDEVFFEDFGTSNRIDSYFGRKTSPYMPNNSFKFGTPYPISTNYDEFMVDNNHYAVVAPGYIKGGIDLKAPGVEHYFWTPGYNESNTLTDRSGTEEGAVLVINAGNTLLPFYHRETGLESNTIYKASFWMYLVKGPSRVAIDIINKATGEVLGTVESEKMEDWSAVYKGKWVKHELYFSTPTITAGCNLDKVFISIRNAHAAEYGNDYYIDDIKLSKFSCDIPTDVIEIACPQPAKPIATADINQTPENTPVGGKVLTNDSGEDIKVTEIVVIDENGKRTSVSVPTTGTITKEVYALDKNGDPVKAGTITIGSNGEYTFAPEKGYTGNVSMAYTIADRNGKSDTTTLSIEVIPAVHPSDNSLPIAQDDAYTTVMGSPINSNILSNDSDVDGNTLTVDGIKQGGNVIPVGTTTPVSGKDVDGNTVAKAGTVTIGADGKITFVPEYGFVGEIDPINYTITDGKGGTDKANIYLNVIPDTGANTTFANDDANTGKKGETLTGNVLENDNDPEGNTQTLTSVTIDGVRTPITSNKDITISSKGKLTMSPDGSYTFVPEKDFMGTIVVAQTVCDNGTPQACDIATLYLTILDKKGALLITNPMIYQRMK